MKQTLLNRTLQCSCSNGNNTIHESSRIDLHAMNSISHDIWGVWVSVFGLSSNLLQSIYYGCILLSHQDIRTLCVWCLTNSKFLLMRILTLTSDYPTIQVFYNSPLILWHAALKQQWHGERRWYYWECSLRNHFGMLSEKNCGLLWLSYGLRQTTMCNSQNGIYQTVARKQDWYWCCCQCDCETIEHSYIHSMEWFVTKCQVAVDYWMAYWLSTTTVQGSYPTTKHWYLSITQLWVFEMQLHMHYIGHTIALSRVPYIPRSPKSPGFKLLRMHQSSTCSSVR